VFATFAAFLAVVVTSAVTVLAVGPIFNTAQYLTFSGPFALPGVTLEAGEYSFQHRGADSGHIVQVRGRRSHRPVFTGFTIPTARPATLQKGALVTLGEARPGQPPPVEAWFPAEGKDGFRFLYPSPAR
jgi:hypothetical protein